MTRKNLRHGEKQLTAAELRALLAVRHKDDVFVPECKDGPSQNTTHLRLDAWAMNKSWSNATSWGYEIKVNRSDFLRDGKWQSYLKYCNEFYFVCPHGLIDQSELPPEAGLIYATANGGRLFTKRKAVRRQLDVPACIYQYILMNRVSVVRNSDQASTIDKRAGWREWLAQRSEDRDLGRAVSRKVRQTLFDRIEAVETKNRELVTRMKGYDEVRALMVKLGFSPDAHAGWAVHQKIYKLSQAVPGDLEQTIDAAIHSLGLMREQLNRITAVAESAKGAA